VSEFILTRGEKDTGEDEDHFGQCMFRRRLIELAGGACGQIAARFLFRLLYYGDFFCSSNFQVSLTVLWDGCIFKLPFAHLSEQANRTEVAKACPWDSGLLSLRTDIEKVTPTF